MTTFVGIVFVLGGLFFLGCSVPGLWLGVSSRRWPTTEGEILESKVELDRLGADELASGGRCYCPRVRYRYRVGDHEYTSANVLYGGYCDTKEAAAEVASGYKPTSRVLVHYHPRHPGWAVLKPGAKLTLLHALAIFAFVVMVAIGISLILLIAFGGDLPGMIGLYSEPHRVHGLTKRSSGGGPSFLVVRVLHARTMWLGDSWRYVPSLGPPR